MIIEMGTDYNYYIEHNGGDYYVIYKHTGQIIISFAKKMDAQTAVQVLNLAYLNRQD